MVVDRSRPPLVRQCYLNCSGSVQCNDSRSSATARTGFFVLYPVFKEQPGGQKPPDTRRTRGTPIPGVMAVVPFNPPSVIRSDRTCHRAGAHATFARIPGQGRKPLPVAGATLYLAP